MHARLHMPSQARPNRQASSYEPRVGWEYEKVFTPGLIVGSASVHSLKANLVDGEEHPVEELVQRCQDFVNTAAVSQLHLHMHDGNRETKTLQN